MNSQILNWFNQGKIKEVLLGEGEFFIPDHTYRSHHDGLLVIYQLFEWVDSEEKRNIVSGDFYAAIDEFLKNNIKEGFRLILGYCIAKNSKKKLLLDESFLISKTMLMIKEYAGEIVTDEKLRAIVLDIEKYLPQVRACK